MKTRIWVPALALAALGLSSCNGIMGNGKIETETRHLPRFDSIDIGTSGSLTVHRGDFKVEVSSDTNVLPHVLTEVVGTELRIGFKPGDSGLYPTKLAFVVTLPELSALHVGGSGEVAVDPFTGENLELAISGSGSLDGDFVYAKGDLEISGSGNSRLKAVFGRSTARLSGSGSTSLQGSADSLDLVVSGSGSCDARDFSVDKARVRLSGSGSGDIRVASNLQARLSGSGRLSYRGDPRVDYTESGSGRISKAGD